MGRKKDKRLINPICIVIDAVFCFVFFFPDVDGGSVRTESEKNCICGDVIIARASFVRIVLIFRLVGEEKEECTIEKVKDV